MESIIPRFKKIYLIVVLLICCSAIVKAQTIKGKVSDAKNGEALIGATVHIEKGAV
ncbi:MAG: hypothetical protein JWR67_136, partial [Mucilaginibacter sp.]|nr:hypothetical protein [Mucilaginibacter sp.]